MPAPASNLPEAQAPTNPPPATSQADNAPAAQPAAPQTPPPAATATPTPGATPNAVVPGQGSQATPPSPAAPTPPAAASQAATGAVPAPAPASASPTTASPTADQTASAGAVPPAAKVVIRANRDSWIEIRDKDDNVVLQKVLRQGESFNVPDQKGLLMTTGNAGGIVIELQGKALQSLGSLGVVKRGIKLDPTALSDGSAFQTDDN